MFAGHIPVFFYFCIINSNTLSSLTPWSRVLLEKLTGFAASQEIPRIYGTRKFITVLTSARHPVIISANPETVKLI
jgi:hypothetical protein